MTGSTNFGRSRSLSAASAAAFFFSCSCWFLRSIRSCVRLARSAKSSAPADRVFSWESSLLLAIDGLTACASEAAAVVSLPPPSVRAPTEAAAIPATPITHAEGTATVSSAERLAGVRRRERAALRAPARVAGAGVTSSWSSSRPVTAGSSPVPPGSSVPGTCSAKPVSAYGASCWYGVCAKAAVACGSPTCSKRAVACWPNGSPASGSAGTPWPPEFHWVASYVPVSKVWVPHSHCCVGPAPSDWSGCSQALASHWPLMSLPVAWAGTVQAVVS